MRKGHLSWVRAPIVGDVRIRCLFDAYEETDPEEDGTLDESEEKNGEANGKASGESDEEGDTESSAAKGETESETESETQKETPSESTERGSVAATEGSFTSYSGGSSQVIPYHVPSIDFGRESFSPNAAGEIYEFLTKTMELNHAAAVGILANIELESAYSTSALGDGGTSYGL